MRRCTVDRVFQVVSEQGCETFKIEYFEAFQFMSWNLKSTGHTPKKVDLEWHKEIFIEI